MSIQSKHFLNTPASLVTDSLQGLCDINPALSLDVANKVIYITEPDRSKVAILCGGGSGHEPAHPGFVGDGVLNAAVCGSVFASPNASQVTRGLDLVDNEKGTIIVVKNYTGDVLNFGLAKEQYAALHPDRADRLRFVIVGDDVAVGRKQGAIVGRRGVAGTVLVYKIAGALARHGASLDDVHKVAQYVADNLVSIGVGLEHCHVPGTADSASHLGTNEIEIGMGIHNESGTTRVSPVPPLSKLMPDLVNMLIDTKDADRSFVPFKGRDHVVLLVNNLGGLSELEVGGLVSEARKAAEAKGLIIDRILAGTFMTSLNMPGFSVTLLLLPTNGPITASSLLSLLDEPTGAQGWKWSSRSVPAPLTAKIQAKATKAAAAPVVGAPLKAADPKQFTASIENACKALVKEEPELTRMDSIAGDGDCGLTLEAGAKGVLKKLQDGTINGNDVIGAVNTIAAVAEEVMGGTSGALYSIFFSGLSQGLQASRQNSPVVTPQIWALALTSALTKLYTYTRARPPSRTLVDPLAAFVLAFAQSNSSSGFAQALGAAAAAAEHTKNIEAKAGRSAYVEGDRLREEQVADPGAWGVKVILESL